MVRRILGLVLFGLMLQLNARASDLVCAKHDAESSGNSSQHAAMAMMGAHDQPATGEQKSCEIPVTKDCCQAVTSCAMIFDLGAKGPGAHYVLDHHLAPHSKADALASAISSPEPPPPKL